MFRQGRRSAGAIAARFAPQDSREACRRLRRNLWEVSLKHLGRVGYVEITVNGQLRRVAEGTTLAELLEQLGLADKHVAVEANLELVPRQRHAGHRLADGDRLEIVTLVGGG